MKSKFNRIGIFVGAAILLLGLLLFACTRTYNVLPESDIHK